MSVQPARALAHRVLGEVRRRAAFAPRVLDDALSSADLDPRDRGFATWLVYGALQYQGTLDEVIDRFLTRPDKTEPAIRDALRIATLELLFGDVPARAAVNEGVEAVKRIRPHAAGLANAVLRRVAGEADAFPWGDVDEDMDALTRSVGHPRWLVERWIEELGRETAIEVMRADNEAAPLYLRHNPFAGDIADAVAALEQDGARPAACELPGCLWVETPAAAVNGRAIADSLVVVTDAAAQFATIAADPRPGQTIVEVGSGHGTKTLGLAALAFERGGQLDLVATDLSPDKVRLAEERARELGIPGVRGIASDGRALAGPVGALPVDEADVVLVDAPCSGLGTLRRHPAKRWRITPTDVDRLASLQLELLQEASRLVRPGGAIVYSTCAISKTENQDVVRAFLGSEAGESFRTSSLESLVPAAWNAWATDEGWFQSLPSFGGPDGHFVARIERR